jgi:hypothetical protein
MIVLTSTSDTVTKYKGDVHIKFFTDEHNDNWIFIDGWANEPLIEDSYARTFDKWPESHVESIVGE